MRAFLLLRKVTWARNQWSGGLIETLHLDHTDQAALGRAAGTRVANHPGQSGFHLWGNGLDALVAHMPLTDR
jgi:hypothetical protein